MRRFNADPSLGGVNLVSISFDVAGDSTSRLREYAAHYGAETGRWRIARLRNASDLRALLRAFGIVVIPDGVGGFQHNAAIHLLNTEGRLAGCSMPMPLLPTWRAVSARWHGADRRTDRCAPCAPASTRGARGHDDPAHAGADPASRGRRWNRRNGPAAPVAGLPGDVEPAWRHRHAASRWS